MAELSPENKNAPGRAATTAARLVLPSDLVQTMRSRLAEVAEKTVSAITVEVPSYSGAWSGPMGQTIENAVRLAFSGLVDLLSAPVGAPDTPLAPVLDGAYALGRGEARSGRSMDALLAAYRVGARVAWREFATFAVDEGVEPGAIAEFAELVFAYIDELSAASVTGHSDELATTGRVRQRYLQQLCHHLLAGASPDVLVAAAERAEWTPPTTLTAVLLPQSRARGVLSSIDARTLEPGEEATLVGDDYSVLLVPDVHGRARQRLLRDLDDRQAVVGPARPWMAVASSFARAARGREIAPGSPDAVVDTDAHLVELVLRADTEALHDLRSDVLAPLSGVRESTAEKLVETLRAWLLHHGRREDVAAALFVHPQTVRYRLALLRDLYGERLDDPEFVLALTVALGTKDDRL